MEAGERDIEGVVAAKWAGARISARANETSTPGRARRRAFSRARLSAEVERSMPRRRMAGGCKGGEVGFGSGFGGEEMFKGLVR